MTSSNSWNVQCLSQKPVIPRDSTHQSSHLVSKQHPRRPKAAPRPSSIPGSCTHKASQSNKTSGYDFTLQTSGSMSKHHMHRKYVASKSNTILNKTLWTDQIWSDCTPVIHLYNNPEIDWRTVSNSINQFLTNALCDKEGWESASMAKLAKLPLQRPPTSYFPVMNALGKKVATWQSSQRCESNCKTAMNINSHQLTGFRRTGSLFSFLRQLLPRCRNKKTHRPPVAAEMVVFIATCAAIAPVEPLLMPKVDPGLKPYHPGMQCDIADSLERIENDESVGSGVGSKFSLGTFVQFHLWQTYGILKVWRFTSGLSGPNQESEPQAKGAKDHKWKVVGLKTAPWYQALALTFGSSAIKMMAHRSKQSLKLIEQHIYTLVYAHKCACTYIYIYQIYIQLYTYIPKIIYTLAYVL